MQLRRGVDDPTVKYLLVAGIVFFDVVNFNMMKKEENNLAKILLKEVTIYSKERQKFLNIKVNGTR